jgi:hypothetical protein
VSHEVATNGRRGRRFAIGAFRFGLLLSVVAACSSSLGTGEWLWCRQNLPAVDIAADQLGIAKAQIGYDEPTWLPDYVQSALLSSTAVISANPDFAAACDQASKAAGMTDSPQFWCLNDGIGKVWAASVAQGAVTHFEAETFAYKAISLDKRIDSPEFVRACATAYGAAHG